MTISSGLLATLFVATFLAVTVAALRLFRLTRLSDLINPALLFVLFFAVTHFAIPAIHLIVSEHWHQQAYEPTTMAAGYAYFVLFLLVTLSAHGLLRSRFSTPPAPAVGDERWRKPYVLPLIIGVLLLSPIALSAVMNRLYQVQGVGLSDFLARRITLTHGTGYSTMPLDWFLPFSIATLCVLLMVPPKYRGTKLLLAVTLVLLASLSLLSGALTGSRTRVLMLLVIGPMALMALRSHVKLTVSRVVSILLAVAVLAVSADLLRQVRAGMMASTFETTGLQVAGARLLESTQAFPEYENLWWLLENRHRWELAGGQTFWAGLVNFIPRSIWQHKPLGGGPLLKNWIMPGSYELGVDRSVSSYTTGLVAESYMNAGGVGVLVAGSIYGCLLALLGHLLRVTRNPIGTAASVLLLFRVLELLRGEFLGVLSKTGIDQVPLVLMLLVSALLWAIARRPTTRPRSASLPEHSGG